MSNHQFVNQVRVLWIAALVVLVVGGCSDSSKTADQKREKQSSATVSVGVAYALGGKGDLTYNDAANRGTTKLKGMDISVKEYEPTTLDDYFKGLELLSIANLRIIFCVGFLYDEPVTRLAGRYPNTIFVVLDGGAKVPGNVASIKFNAQEGSILAGAVAGAVSKRKHVSFIGGADIPIINEFFRGFSEGIKLSEAGTQVYAFYIGTGGTAFTDPVKGLEVGLTAIERGSDVLFHAAGSSGNGVIKAAKEKGVYAIGVDVDQSHLAPGTVVTSMLKNFDVAMVQVVDRVAKGEAIGGQNIILGVRDGAVSLAPLSKEVEAIAKDALSKAESRVRGEAMQAR